MNPRFAERPRGNSKSREQTRRAAPLTIVPSEGWDGRDFPGSCERPVVPPLLYQEEARDSIPKSAVFPVRSRMAFEIPVLHFRERVRIGPAFVLHLINEYGQGGTRPRVSNNPLPGGIPVQLRQQCWQVSGQLFPLLGRQRTNGRFDFLNRIHLGGPAYPNLHVK